jgi:2'-5' RNA ligase
MEQIRSFIAIELPREVKQGLGMLVERLRGVGHPLVKWVEPEGIHLTLKFLGNVASDKLPEIIRVTGEAVQGISPFAVEIRGLGTFPSWQRPQVVWVGVKDEANQLIDLQKNIDAALRDVGFPPEPRFFTPHLTLARVRERAKAGERQEFGNWLCSAKFDSCLDFTVNAISLMKSELTPKGAIYTRLAWIELI